LLCRDEQKVRNRSEGQSTAARTQSSLESNVDTGSENGESSQVILYPNPGSGEFDVVIEDDYSGLYYLLVRDFSGKVLEKQTIMKEGKMTKTHIDLKQASEGSMFLSLYAMERR